MIHISPIDQDLENEMYEAEQYDFPGVSYIIPCYNHGDFVQDAVISCALQAYPGPKEIIIINDGSDDETTQEILALMEQTQFSLLETQPAAVRVVHHEENRGLASARNTGFHHAQYDYVVPLDADDELHKDFTTMCYTTMLTQTLFSEKECGFVYTDVRHFGKQNNVWKLPDFNADALLSGPYIVCTSFMNRNMWLDVANGNGTGYDTDISALGGWEDYLFYLEAVLHGWKGVHVNAPLFYYRKHAVSSMIDIANENLTEIKQFIRQKIHSEYGVNVL